MREAQKAAIIQRMSTHTAPHPEASAPPPTAEQVRAARTAAGQTQAEAAALIHMGARAWRHYETGARAMHPAFWELYRIKSITK